MEQVFHQSPCARTQTLTRINLTKRMLSLALTTVFRHHNLPLSLHVSIMAYLYSSPIVFGCDSYILVSGQCEYRLKKEEKMLRKVAASINYSIKEKQEFLVGCKSIYCSHIKVSKIWKMPETKTQKKILAHGQLLKSFFSGDHLKEGKKKVLNRTFLFPSQQIDKFSTALQNMNNWSVNFCSYQILKDYIYLIMRNYIQLEFKQYGSFVYYIIAEGYSGPIINEVYCEKSEKGWRFAGKKQMVWKKMKRFSRTAKHILLQNHDTYLVENSTCLQTVINNHEDNKIQKEQFITYTVE